MKEQDKTQFSSMMAIFAESMGEKVSANKMDVYFETLSEYTIEEITTAGKRLLKTAKFFPKIADFVEIIEGDSESKASNAWYSLEKAYKRPGIYKTLDLNDPVAHQVVKDMNLWAYGIENNRYPDERKDYDYIRQEFMRRYRTVNKSGKNLPLTLPGIYELENDRKFAAGEDRSWTDIQISMAKTYKEDRLELENQKTKAIKPK